MFKRASAVLKHILKVNKKIDIHVHNEWIFRNACENGYWKIVRYLWRISKNIDDIIDIHANNDWSLRYACKYEHSLVVKFLYSLYTEEAKENNETIVKYRKNYRELFE